MQKLRLATDIPDRAFDASLAVNVARLVQLERAGSVHRPRALVI
jgi:hypothetical protein